MWGAGDTAIRFVLYKDIVSWLWHLETTMMLVLSQGLYSPRMGSAAPPGRHGQLASAVKQNLMLYNCVVSVVASWKHAPGWQGNIGDDEPIVFSIMSHFD